MKKHFNSNSIIKLILLCAVLPAMAQTPSFQWAKRTFITGGASVGDGVHTTQSTDMDIDNNGNVFIAGNAATGFPTYATGSSYVFNGLANYSDYGFIVKFDNNGVRKWATLYGGNTSAPISSICLDGNGNLFATGYSAFSDLFPSLNMPNAYNRNTINSYTQDAFILKFNNNGERLWATCIGADDATEEGNAIACDNAGNVFIGGRAEMADTQNPNGWDPGDMMPLVSPANSYSQQPNNYFNSLPFTHYEDGFFAKFSAGSHALVWLTYYGGQDHDQINSIACNSVGDLLAYGSTEAIDFPIQSKAGAYNDPSLNGAIDVVLIKFRNNGEREWATYYGGSANGAQQPANNCVDYISLYERFEKTKKIVVDKNTNDFYIINTTNATNMPVSNAEGSAFYLSGNSGGYYKAFITKFNSNLSQRWASYFSENSFGGSLAIDPVNKKLFIVGAQGYFSSSFPAVNPLNNAWFDNAVSGSYDCFISRFNIPSSIKTDPSIQSESSIGIEETEFGQQENSNLSVYPNPTTGKFILKHSETNSNVIIYSSIGEIVYKQKLENDNNEVDLSALNNGVYFVKAVNSIDNSQKTIKIIKQ